MAGLIRAGPADVVRRGEATQLAHAGDQRLALRDVIAQGRSNDVIGKMRVSALLESMPGVGRVRARQIMEEVGISGSRRVRGLGQNQEAALLERFGRQ